MKTRYKIIIPLIVVGIISLIGIYKSSEFYWMVTKLNENDPYCMKIWVIKYDGNPSLDGKISHTIRTTIAEFGPQYDNPFREIRIEHGQRHQLDEEFLVEESSDTSGIYEIYVGGSWKSEKVSVITSALEKIPELTMLNNNVSMCA